MEDKYLVVINADHGELMRRVNALIGTGWKPQGGVSWAKNGLAGNYVQAMYKGGK